MKKKKEFDFLEEIKADRSEKNLYSGAGNTDRNKFAHRAKSKKHKCKIDFECEEDND